LFTWLDAACRLQVPELTFVRADPIYDSIRHDPRFDALLKCVHVAD